MSRFSPTVRPTAGTSFLENVANAFTDGMRQYGVSRDRAEADVDRSRRRRRETEQDEIAGFTDTPRAADNFAGPVGPPQDEFDELAQVAGGVAPAGPRSSSGVPGGFDVLTGDFEPPPPPRVAPMRLSTGRTYDPQAVFDRESMFEMQRGAATRAEAERARRGGVNRRLQGLMGLEGIDSELATAGADNEALYNALVQTLSGARGPRRGTKEYEEMLEGESRARSKGTGTGRGESGSGNFSELAQQINDAQEEVTRIEREEPKPKRTSLLERMSGMASPEDLAIDPELARADSTFRADSTRTMGEWRGRLDESKSVLEGLRNVRGDRARAERGGAPPRRPNPPTTARQRQRDTEMRALDERLNRVLQSSNATEQQKQRARAAHAQMRDQLIARYNSDQ